MTAAGRRVPAAVLLVGALAWVAGWMLAGGQAAPAAAGVRAVADVAAVTVVGLSVLPMLEDPRHRAGLVRAAGRPLAVAAAVWLFAEGLRVVVSAAQSADVPVARLRLHTVAEFAGTAGGRAAVLSALAAAVVCAAALVSPNAAGRLAVTGAAAVGLGARAVSGHVGQSALGAVAIVVHILAAALWCGVLAALALTVHHRGRWARILPRFSRLALVSAVAVLIAGTAAALVTVSSPAELVTSGYGRVLLAKVVVAGVLVLVGRRHRTRWVPAAGVHRLTAEQSRGRAWGEVLLMVTALTLAAALAVAG